MAADRNRGADQAYGTARGIEDVTLAVEPGEVFGFLGPNGAGKTTTIRTLLDLLHPTGGSARIFGLDSRRDSVEIRSRLGNLPGRFRLRPDATGRAALALLAAPSRHRRHSAVRRSWRALPGPPRAPARAALTREPAEGRADLRDLPRTPSC